MTQMIIALIGMVILIPILLVLPSVFTKLGTFIHIIMSSFYFILGLFLLEFIHWSIVGVVIFFLIMVTAFLLSQRADSLKLETDELA
ncbi:hypothetical protein [Salipaludibacillus daqingensis]|uniref:hypothetical protein n=1 Tax=Salipaludibacillus daqingensis TaxID=3041001 RepID=UPI002472EF81|nr:hypothetical protein [Salipaludibacillus daqingensis]